jgi:hypothetical protein
MNEMWSTWSSWSAAAPWAALVLLGAFHGVNPAMGWLFAVALGLQRRRRGAVLGALLPLALGHEASIALVVLLGLLVGAAVPPDVLRPAAALGLIAFGAYKLLRPRSHPRWVGMRVGPWDLVLWSFLMASAHGAGLMLLPVLFGLGGPAGAAPPAAAHTHVHAADQAHVHVMEMAPTTPAAPAAPAALPGPAGLSGLSGLSGLPGVSGVALAQDAAAVLVHTGAMLLVMAAVALLVYEKLGLAVLRRAWVNLDAIWAGAVVAAGVFTLFT